MSFDDLTVPDPPARFPAVLNRNFLVIPFTLCATYHTVCPTIKNTFFRIYMLVIISKSRLLSVCSGNSYDHRTFLSLLIVTRLN